MNKTTKREPADVGYSRTLQSVNWTFYFDTEMGERRMRFSYHPKTKVFTTKLDGDAQYQTRSKGQWLQKLRLWLDGANLEVIRVSGPNRT